MVDFIQAGHCSNAHTNNRPKYLIHLDFELGLNPRCIANGKQLHSPDTRLIPTFNYLKWLNLLQSTFLGFGLQCFDESFNLSAAEEFTGPLRLSCLPFCYCRSMKIVEVIATIAIDTNGDAVH
ncbi:Uncharacterised protein [Klebsiella quasipneumoniae]|nr:Uncharacterised protein [Klebsiella quasipneumoniae]